MLAYSAIGQVGYVLVAIGIGGPVGFAAAILYTIVNALNKTLLFLSAQIRGALVAAAFALGAMSVAGLPPAAGLRRQARAVPRRRRTAPPCSRLLFLGGALSFVYAFQVYQYDFWRGERAGPRAGRPQQALIAGLALLVLALGLWPEPLLALSHDAAAGPRRRRPVTGILAPRGRARGDLPARAHQRGAGRRADRRPARAADRRRAAPAPAAAGRCPGAPARCARPVACWRRRRSRWSAGAGASRASASAAPAAPGFVEIPRGDRSRHGVALWGVLTGEAPDEIPVDVDERRRVLIVHLVDAGDPAAVRARHAAHPRALAAQGGALRCPSSCSSVAAGWATLLLVAGGLLLLRARDTLHRILALDVIVTIVVALLTLALLPARRLVLHRRRARARAAVVHRHARRRPLRPRGGPF